MPSVNTLFSDQTPVGPRFNPGSRKAQRQARKAQQGPAQSRKAGQGSDSDEDLLLTAKTVTASGTARLVELTGPKTQSVSSLNTVSSLQLGTSVRSQNVQVETVEPTPAQTAAPTALQNAVAQAQKYLAPFFDATQSAWGRVVSFFANIGATRRANAERRAVNEELLGFAFANGAEFPGEGPASSKEGFGQSIVRKLLNRSKPSVANKYAPLSTTLAAIGALARGDKQRADAIGKSVAPVAASAMPLSYTERENMLVNDQIEQLIPFFETTQNALRNPRTVAMSEPFAQRAARLFQDEVEKLVPQVGLDNALSVSAMPRAAVVRERKRKASTGSESSQSSQDAAAKVPGPALFTSLPWAGKSYADVLKPGFVQTWVEALKG